MIQELIILNNDGIALFYHNFLTKLDKEDDYQLVASFLDQICRFTEAGLKEDLNIIVWKDFIFYFYTHSDTHFRLFFKCDKSTFVSVDVIKRSLDLIAKRIMAVFLLKYKDDLENFKGEISRFKSFSEDIRNIFSSK